jgi:hypothetical protein
MIQEVRNVRCSAANLSEVNASLARIWEMRRRADLLGTHCARYSAHMLAAVLFHLCKKIRGIFLLPRCDHKMKDIEIVERYIPECPCSSRRPLRKC